MKIVTASFLAESICRCWSEVEIDYHGNIKVCLGFFYAYLMINPVGIHVLNRADKIIIPIKQEAP